MKFQISIRRLADKIQNPLNPRSYKLKAVHGFTLIELMVALAAFSSAAIISIGAVLSMSDAQAKILAVRVAQDNLSYALDTMGKEIRVGTHYYCGDTIPVPFPDPFDADNLVATDCNSGDSVFSFKSADGTQVNYRVVNGQIERSTGPGPEPSNKMYVTAVDLVIINNLIFYVRGAGDGIQNPPPTDNKQPMVTIILQGAAGVKEKVKTRVNLQTTISQRSLDQ